MGRGAQFGGTNVCGKDCTSLVRREILTRTVAERKRFKREHGVATGHRDTSRQKDRGEQDLTQSTQRAHRGDREGADPRADYAS